MALVGAWGLTAAELGACVSTTEATSPASWAAGVGVERVCMQDMSLQGAEAMCVLPAALCAHSGGCMQQSKNHMQHICLRLLYSDAYTIHG